MAQLEPPDIHFLSAAIGWMGLGNLAEARAELSHIGPGFRNHPDVLKANWMLCAEEERWDDALQVARSLIHAAPDEYSGWLYQAYALRRVREGGVKRAWQALLPAFDLFPKQPEICFNLSCYACQMKQLDAARTWFKRAMVIGGKSKYIEMALAEPDLEPLWSEIREF